MIDQNMSCSLKVVHFLRILVSLLLSRQLQKWLVNILLKLLTFKSSFVEQVDGVPDNGQVTNG